MQEEDKGPNDEGHQVVCSRDHSKLRSQALHASHDTTPPRPPFSPAYIADSSYSRIPSRTLNPREDSADRHEVECEARQSAEHVVMEEGEGGVER